MEDLGSSKSGFRYMKTDKKSKKVPESSSGHCVSKVPKTKCVVLIRTLHTGFRGSDFQLSLMR